MKWWIVRGSGKRLFFRHDIKWNDSKITDKIKRRMCCKVRIMFGCS